MREHADDQLAFDHDPDQDPEALANSALQRLIVCKNPALVQDRARKREELLLATEPELDTSGGMKLLREFDRGGHFAGIEQPDRRKSGTVGPEGGRVNLLAYLGFPAGGGRSQLDLVPEDPASFRQTVELAGLTPSEAKRAFLIQGDDRAGAAADTTAKVAAANINITAVAATSAGSGRYGMILWVAPADYDWRLVCSAPS